MSVGVPKDADHARPLYVMTGRSCLVDGFADKGATATDQTSDLLGAHAGAGRQAP